MNLPLKMKMPLKEVNRNNNVADKCVLRDRRQIKAPVRYDDFAMIAEYVEPLSYAEAMQSTNCQEWQTAMDSEMSSLIENNTWELVDKPPDRLVVENRWVFRVKMNVDGTVDKFKARLVAKGYSQKAGIVYKADHQPDILTAYSDADYAGDIMTRRSCSGMVCKFMGGAITWNSQRQKCVAMSTTEAELIAASEATKEIVWLSRLLCEITTVTEIPVLMVDNMSTLKLGKNPIFHKRSKHIDVRYFFIRDKVEDGSLTVDHIASDEQIADIFTKPLAKDRFQRLRNLLGVSDKLTG